MKIEITKIPNLLTNGLLKTSNSDGTLIVETIDQNPTDGSTNAVSSNGVFDALSGKQDTLVSATNIKTINGTTLLGSGDLVVSGGGGVLVTVKEILSTDLATQNVAGIVTYINALNPVLVVAANEIVQYSVTDTSQIFQLLLNGRSFGVGQSAITSTNILEVRAIPSLAGTSNLTTIIRNTTVYSITSTGNDDAVATLLIPANTFNTGDSFQCRFWYGRTGGTYGNVLVKYGLSTDSNPALASWAPYMISAAGPTTYETYASTKREVVVRNKTTATDWLASNVTTGSDDGFSNSMYSSPINWGVNQYLHIYLKSNVSGALVNLNYVQLLKY